MLTNIQIISELSEYTDSVIPEYGCEASEDYIHIDLWNLAWTDRNVRQWTLPFLVKHVSMHGPGDRFARWVSCLKYPQVASHIRSLSIDLDVFAPALESCEASLQRGMWSITISLSWTSELSRHKGGMV